MVGAMKISGRRQLRNRMLLGGRKSGIRPLLVGVLGRLPLKDGAACSGGRRPRSLSWRERLAIGEARAVAADLIEQQPDLTLDEVGRRRSVWFGCRARRLLTIIQEGPGR
jgi:hypothetical protein